MLEKVHAYIDLTADMHSTGEVEKGEKKFSPSSSASYSSMYIPRTALYFFFLAPLH